MYRSTLKEIFLQKLSQSGPAVSKGTMLVGFIFVCVCLASHSASAGSSELRNAAVTACEKMGEDIPEEEGFMCGLFTSTPLCVKQMEDVIPVLGIKTVQKFTGELLEKTNADELQNIVKLLRKGGELSKNSAAVYTLLTSIVKLPEGTRLETVRNVLSAKNVKMWITILEDLVDDSFNIFKGGESFYNRIVQEKGFEKRFYLYVDWWVKKGKNKNKNELLSGPYSNLEFLEIMIDFCGLRNDCKDSEEKFLHIFDTFSPAGGERWFNFQALRDFVKSTEMQTLRFEIAVLVIRSASDIVDGMIPPKSCSDWTMGKVFKNINECNNQEGCVKWTLKVLDDLCAMKISSGTYEKFKTLAAESGKKIDIVWHYFRTMRKQYIRSDYDEKLKTETDYSFWYETFKSHLTVVGPTITDIDKAENVTTNSVNSLLKKISSPCWWDALDRNNFMTLVKNYNFNSVDYSYLLDNLSDSYAFCSITKIEEIVKLFYITLGIKTFGLNTIWYVLKEKKIGLNDIFELYEELDDYSIGLDGLKAYFAQNKLTWCSMNTLFYISKYHKRNNLNQTNLNNLFVTACREDVSTYSMIDKATDYNTPISQLLQQISNEIVEQTKKKMLR